MRRLGIIIVALGLVVAAAVLGFRFADPAGFAAAKRATRLALGLPKQWVRGVNTDSSDDERLDCPRGALVIVTGGQSNAANVLSEPLAADPRAAAFMIHAGACYRLRDPVLGASGRGGSLWTGLGSAIWRRTGRPVVFVNGAVAGTQLGDWLDRRSGYLARLAGETRRARAAGLAADYVFWIQGETDAAVSLAPVTYVAQMEALIAAFDAAGAVPPGTPWLVYRSTRCMERPGNGPAIDAALAGLAARSERVILGPLASRLGPEARYDGCHFNGQGRARLIEATMAIIEARLGPSGD